MVKSVECLKEDDYRIFDDYLRKTRKTSEFFEKKLSLAKMPDPHEEIVVCTGLNFDKVNEYCKNNDLFCTNYNSKMVFVNRSGFNELEKNGILFSGYVFNKDNFIFGKNDLVKSLTIPEIRNIDSAYGEYVVFNIHDNKIKLSSDFFGMGTIFYYHHNNVFVACNNYHLLIELLSFNNVNLDIDIDQSRVNLLCTGFELSGSFSRNMDIKDTHILFPHESLVFDMSVNKIDIVNTELFDILNQNESWDPIKYEDYIQRGTTDVLQNTRSIFSNPKFNEIIVDLSGGFDSRVVFACADSLPKAMRNKIRVYSRPSHNGDDFSIASFIRSIFGYPRFSYINVDISPIITDTLNFSQISRNLGCFGGHLEAENSNYYNCSRIELMGGIGDAILGFKRISGTDVYNTLSESEIFDRIGRTFFWRGAYQLDEIYDKKIEFLKSMLNDFNVDCTFKKMHILYTISRNRFHFGSSRHVFNNNPFALPLQSKFLLKAKWMYFNRFHNNEIPDEKVSIDTISEINPLLSTIPFAAENNAVLPKDINLLRPLYTRISIDPSAIDNNVMMDDVSNEDKPLYRDAYKDFFSNIDMVQQILTIIHDFSPAYRNICVAIFKWLELNRNEPITGIFAYYYHDLVCKVYFLYFELLIINKIGCVNQTL